MALKPYDIEPDNLPMRYAFHLMMTIPKKLNNGGKTQS